MRSKLNSVTLTLFALLSICAACSNPPASTGGASTAGGGAAAVAPSQSPQDMLTKSMEAQLNAKSLRANMTSTSSQGTYTATLEYASPDRYRLVSSQGEMVVVGNDAYMKAGGRWVKSPVNAGQLISQFRDPKMVEELRRKTDVKYVGTETLDGQSMFVYEYTLDEVAGKGAKARAKTWISPADMLPRKTEVDGETGGIKSHTTITFSDYNSDIKIEPPK